MGVARTPAPARAIALLAALLASAALTACLALPSPARAEATTTVSLTFDDGDVNQYENALPALNAHGINGTFYINSGHVGGSAEYMTWSQVKAVATAGNEIGGHTIDHANLTAVEPAEAEREICNDRVNLINQGFQPTDFAYPFGAYNATVQSIVAACGYDSGRGLGGLVSPFDGACASGCPFAETNPPAQVNGIRTPDSVTSSMTLSDLQTLVTQAQSHGGGWVPIVFHDVCPNACSQRSISPALFSSFLDWLSEQRTAGAISVRTVQQVVGGAFQPGVAGPPPHGTNLLNPSLETEGPGGLPQCWQTGGFGSNTPAFTRTSDSHSGSWAEQLTVSSYQSGDAKLVSSQDEGACAPAVTPLRNYTVGMWYKATTSPSLIAYYRDQVGTWHFLATSPAFPASGGWTRAQWTTPAMPSEATGISFGPALSSNGSLTFDDLSLELAPPQAKLVGLTPGNTYAGLTSLTAEAGAGTDHVEFLVNGAVVGTATSAPWTIAWSSQSIASGPTTFAARAVDAGGSSSTNGVQVSIDNTGSRIRNASLEWETGGSSLPDCWEADGFGTNSFHFTRTSDAHSGGEAERVDITAYTSGDRKLLQKQDSGLCAPAAVPGREYTLSSWFKSSIKPFFVVFTRNQQGTWTFWTSGPGAGFTGSQTNWTQATWKTPPVPAGTTNISFGLDLNAVGFVTVDDMSTECSSLNCDTTAPTSSASAPALSATGSIAVGYTAADEAGGSGLAKVDLYAKAPGAGAYGKVASDTSGAASGAFAYTAAAGDGSYSFYTVATDKAGNVEAAPASADASTTVDTTAPSSSASSPAVSATTSVSVGYTAADQGGGAGLAKVDLYARAPGAGSYTKVASDSSGAAAGSFSYAAAAGDGTYSFYTVATDKAGNAESAPASADATTNVDTTAPSSSAESPSVSASTSLSVGYSASDGAVGSGVAQVDLYAKAPGQSSYSKVASNTSGQASGSFSYSAEAGDGTYSFYTVATDQAGNAESAPAGADTTTLIDTAAPSSSASAPPVSDSTSLAVGYTASDPAGGSGLAKVDLYVKAPGQGAYAKVATDSSGAASGSFSFAAEAGDGVYSFYTVATDKAGNAEAAPGNADAATLVVTVAPTSSASAPAVSGSEAVRVGYTASSSLGVGIAEVDLYAKAPGQSAYAKVASDTSGATSGSFAYTAAAGDGAYSFYTVATDRAGNVESAPASADATTVLDTTAPASSASAPAVSGASVAVGYTTSDGAGSGVAQVDLYVRAPGAGSYGKVASDTSGAASGAFAYTAAAGDGSYSFYTVATDKAGNVEAAPASADASTLVDTTAPSSSVSSPALAATTSVSVGYTAADQAGGAGLAEVDLYAEAPGQSTYSKVASDTSGAASGSFAYTAAAGDGSYSFYAVATDVAGNVEAAPASADASTLVDTAAPSSSATAPSTSATGSWSVAYTASDGAGSGIARVDLYAKAPGQSTYSKIASDSSGSGAGAFPYGAAVGNGSYSFYTVATDKAGHSEAAPASADASTAFTRDTTAPTSKATAPANSATASFSVGYTASDNGGGDQLTAVELWVKSPSAKTYARAATNTGPALTGSFTYTATVGEGVYSFYTIAADEMGNRQAAPATANATTRFDGLAPTAFTVASPGQYVHATPKLTLASAPTDAGSGMASVAYQYRAAGTTGPWLSACSATASPWSCGWNTATPATPDGAYELRAVAADRAGNTTLASNAPLGPITVDNTVPTPKTVATQNVSGGTAGRVEAGDSVAFGFSETMAPGSLLEGWNGSAVTVQVRLTAKSAKDTTLAVYNAAGTVQVALANPLDLGAAYVPSGGAVFAATMAQNGASVTVTLGALSSGAVLATPAAGGTLTWTPSNKATDLAGNKVTTAKVTAAGPAF